MRQERLKRRILEDIQRQLVQLLATRGVAATLELTHAEAILAGPAGKSRAKLGDLPSQWRQLTPQQRTARLLPLVEHLSRGMKAMPAHRKWSVSAPLIALVLLTAGLGGAVVRDLIAHRRSLARAGGGHEEEQAKIARSQRVCEATRSRVMRGGTAGPTDHEGWVVELIVVGRSAADGGIIDGWREYFTGTDAGQLKLREADQSLTEAGAGYGELIRHEDGGLSELRLVLHEGYARAYFDELGRRVWVELAANLFQKTGARYGALVARCSHQRSHHIGSWFAGASPQAAAAALLHYAGVYSETPVFTRDYLPADPAVRPELSLLTLFEKRTGGIDRTELAMWLSPEQGLVSGRSESGLTLQFPYRDSNRASRAGLRLARRLEIANSR